jgi:hypothetical protein
MARQRRAKSVAFTLTFTLVLALTLPAHAAQDADNASWLDRFRDPQDGSFDMSSSLLEHKGVLPVPTLITEPAIGYGLGLALLYFTAPGGSRTHPDGANAASDSAAQDANPDATQKMTPPNITAVGGFATGSHSWGAALIHFHTWDDDRIRYLGVLGKVDLHLNYYGPQGNANAYQLSGMAIMQQVLFRIADSPWYIGPRYTFFDSATRFGPVLPDSIQNFERDVRIGKSGIVVDYDTRDNIFYANRGTYAEFEADFARGGFGSSNAFDMQTFKAYHWIPLSPRWVLGLRVDTGFSQGDIPFFAQPYVSLRGVSDAKFQDRNQLTGEIELRWKVTPRWSVLGFGGAGKAYGNLHSFGDAPTAFGFGTGFRYLIARKLGLSMGIDIAHGPGQNAFYIQVGSAWH